MANEQPHHSKKRRTYLRLFLLSTSVFVIAGLFLFTFLLSRYGSGPDQILVIGSLVATATSCLASAITLIGFVSTTIFAWRQDRREARELELIRQGIDIEKARFELEKPMTGES